MNPAESYILNQPEPYRSILLHLQAIIEKAIPEAELLYKWRLPFYYLNGKQAFCYMNFSKKYVDLVFWHGAHLTRHTEHLVSDGRKHMKSLRYNHLEDINDQILIEVLLEAYEFRGEKYYKS
ncbi:MAG: 2-dehydro-3-deoxyphosphooctonate aldolase [Alteromonas sp.]|nr:2-dehydro-3-deoxyphosphooctonate aldolase [Alteromonas sp.]MAY21550.1 2-dehydro-3-deoxyphosphooctonate aldolase [Flavobacteriaceae bacterium]|tara:strand:- start:43678 stop:44043 length:366 start_codon:yes stop_codon:yes gene_type:complete